MRSKLCVLCAAGLLGLAKPAFTQVDGTTTVIRQATPAGSVHLKPTLKEPPQTDPNSRTASAETFLSRIEATGDATQARLHLSVSGGGWLRAFVVQSPAQVIVEGEGLTFGSDLAAGRLPERLLVTDFRFGTVHGTEGRIVFDLTRPARVAAFEHVHGNVTLQLVALGPGQTAGDALTLDLSAEPTPAAATMSAAPPNAATMAPPRRHVIMIDPGHGGRDPGAVTETGVYEKDVVLAVAKRLRAELAARGTFDVRLTRDGDTALTLDRRVALSRQARADLFISLHADTFAGQPQAAAVRGGAVYVLSETASNRVAAVLADKENAADARLGADAGASTGDAAVDGFLSDLVGRETQTFATTFQSGLVRSLTGAMQLARDPARGAAFRVLKQAETPAVLVELGYMSHAQDIALLQSPEWHGKVAVAVARAVDAYFAAPRSALGVR